jgi:hypothetical protein
MEIKIIGSNCKNGMQLYKMATRAADNVREDVKVIKEDDKSSVKKYGINNIPGLVVNEKLICQGKVLTDREISKFLN